MSDTTDAAGRGTGSPGRGGGRKRVQPLSAKAVTSEAQLASGGCVLHGWNCRETTGAAGAVVELYDGSSNGGTFLGTMGLGNGVFGAITFDEHGIDVGSGLHAHVVTGTADVIVYVELLPPGGAG